MYSHIVETRLVPLVSVPWIYILFKCRWHPHLHLQSWLYPWTPYSILGILLCNYNRYPQSPNAPNRILIYYLSNLPFFSGIPIPENGTINSQIFQAQLSKSSLIFVCFSFLLVPSSRPIHNLCSSLHSHFCHTSSNYYFILSGS